jgi:hypothetical protein
VLVGDRRQPVEEQALSEGMVELDQRTTSLMVEKAVVSRVCVVMS